MIEWASTPSTIPEGMLGFLTGAGEFELDLAMEERTLIGRSSVENVGEPIAS